MIIDQHQREQALEPTKSYIMQAPAGSGKTEILIQRILALLNTVTKPEEILALTFTRKAAAEMRARILRALSMQEDEIISEHQKTTYALAQKIIQKNKQLNWQLETNPSRLQISTIDSFAAGLVNQMPILSQLGSKSSILDNPKKIYQQAAKNTIKLLESDSRWSNALFELTSYFDNQFIVMEELFVSMLSKREQWLPHITKTENSIDIKNSFDKCLQDINFNCVKNVYNSISETDRDELLELAKFSAQFSFSMPNIKLDELKHVPQPHANNIELWKFFASLILTKGLTLRKKITIKEGFPSQSKANNAEEKQLFETMKQRMVAFLEKIATTYDLLAILKDIVLSPPNNFPENQWIITKYILEILPLLVANLMLIFKEKNAIDFCELNLRSMNTLEIDGSPTDLSLALDYKIKHILIDEFQDTSNHHFKLIKKLTTEWHPDENKTIFIVGDPMQSIYRFREAEVGLFLKVKQQGINNINLLPLTLESNFRSHQSIVNWGNNIFAPSFPQVNDITKGAIAFSPSKAANTTNLESDINIHVSSSNEHQARIIIKLIKKNLKQYPGRKIAILARARKHLTDLINQLQQTNINFIAHEIDNIYDKPIIHDLLAITRSIHDITDRLAWLAILRAPWCGLELSDLLAISKNSTTSTVYEVITSDLNNISDWGAKRLKQLKPTFIYMVKKSGRIPLNQLVEESWRMLGGPNTLKSFNDLQWVKQYLNLLETHLKNNARVDLIDFEEQLFSTHITPDNKIEPNIELMTIHKSKGLEFDMVFILGGTNISPNPERNILEWIELQTTNLPSLLLAPIKGIGHEKNPIYEYLYRLSKQKDDYEKIRLMYVAATRAKLKLLIFATIPEDQDITSFKPPKSSLIYPFWAPIIENSTIINHKAQDFTKEYTNPNPLYRVNKISDIAIHNKLNPLEESNKNLEKYDIANKIINTNIGIVAHDILRLIVENNLIQNSKYHQLISENKLSEKLIRLGTPKHAISNAINTISDAIKNTISDTKGKWILNPNHTKSKCEMPLTANINNKSSNIIIDRTFVENNTRWIIDYKVTMPHQNFILTLSNIKQQYGEQLDNYARILSIQEKYPIMLGIYLPIQQKWFTWEYQIGGDTLIY